MSNDNPDSDSQQDGTSGVSITFETFQSFFKSNSDLDNIEYYKQFPSVNTGTIRSWKARAKKNNANPPPSVPQTSPDGTKETNYRDDMITLLKQTTKVQEYVLEGLEPDAQLRLLQNMHEQQKSTPDPNIHLMTPSGSGGQKLGIDQYIRIDEKSFKEKGFGKVDIRIPASELHNPEQAKKLNQYN